MQLGKDVDPGIEGTRQPTLQQIIRERQGSIIAAWEVAVRDLPLPTNLPGPLLRDEMPEVVERIASMVGSPRPQPSPAGGPAEKHALQRLGVGFELAHLLMEYSILRNCILGEISGAIQLTIDDHIALNHAIDTVANHSIERFSEASERLLKALDAISAQALRSKNLDELLHRLLKVLMNTSPAVDSVAILLKQDGVLQVRAAEGVIAERDPRFTIRVGEGFSGTIAATAEPLLSRSAARDPLVKSEFIRIRRIQALYGVPLVETEVIGVAHMGSLTVHDFTQEEKLLFQAMASRATAAIIHTQLLEQLEIEHRLLLSTMRQMPIGVLIRDASGRLLIANEAAERMRLGTPPSAAGADSPGMILCDRGGKEIPQPQWPYARALQGRETVGEVLVAKCADGRARDLEVSAAPIRDQEGRIVAAVVVFEDVTERMQAEAEREIYISSMSHDLRAPLSVIRMAAEMILRRDRVHEPDDAKALSRIHANAARMETLIQQLLDFARSRHAGGIPLSRRPTDLVALSRQIVDALQPGEAQRVQLRAAGIVEGEWDPDRLSQLLQNLIGNALEHGRRDAPVEVAVTGDERVALLRVTNGSVAAIPAELLPHIFDPFRKGSDRGGLGLGLYISQQIAKAHGAEIQVSTDPRSTTFQVALPRRIIGT